VKAVAIIPARGGSKRLPRKNLRPLCGVPLIAWSIRAARDARLVSEVYVSTDDLEIATEAKRYGAEVVMRPAFMANDRSAIEEALYHAVETTGCQPDMVVTLQPTSPMRAEGLIDRCIRKLAACPTLNSVLTVVPAGVVWRMEQGDKPHWVTQFGERKIPQSQRWTTADERYSEDGSVFVTRWSALRTKLDRRCLPTLPIVNEWSPDIDEESDLRLAETLLRAREEVPA
jgi:CMP-N,N'-diacetyllegionaminic acid synthase